MTSWRLNLTVKSPNGFRRLSFIERTTHLVTGLIPGDEYEGDSRQRSYFTYHPGGRIHWKVSIDTHSEHTVKLISMLGPPLDEFYGFSKISGNPLAATASKYESEIGEIISEPTDEDIVLPTNFDESTYWAIPCIFDETINAELLTSGFSHTHIVEVRDDIQPSVAILGTCSEGYILDLIPRHMGDFVRIYDEDTSQIDDDWFHKASKDPLI